MTTTVSAWTALSAAHPQHAERIQNHVGDMLPGALVTATLYRTDPARFGGTYTTTDFGGFYTGIKEGDTVAVSDYREWKGHESRSVQVLDGEAAHLSVNSGHVLTPTDPSGWTYEDAKSAQAAATKAATGVLEQAVAFANHSEPDEGRALAALRTVDEYRKYAFAVGVYADFVRDEGWRKTSYRMAQERASA